MTITQEDRQAAASLNPGVARFYLNGGNDHYKIVQAFAAHRIAAEQRIVEWLERRADAVEARDESERDFIIEADGIRSCANAIIADEHLLPCEPHHGRATKH